VTNVSLASSKKLDEALYSVHVTVQKQSIRSSIKTRTSSALKIY